MPQFPAGTLLGATETTAWLSRFQAGWTPLPMQDLPLTPTPTPQSLGTVILPDSECHQSPESLDQIPPTIMVMLKALHFRQTQNISQVQG